MSALKVRKIGSGIDVQIVATKLADAVQFLSARGYVVEPRGDRWRPHCPDAEWVLVNPGIQLISDAGLIETVSNMRWLEEGTVIGHGRD